MAKDGWLIADCIMHYAWWLTDMMADRYLRDKEIGIMADRLNSERLRCFDFRWLDR